ncbi:MAG: chloride channel protein [Alphaproteobacteria bacterium]|jgi:H+/Cl- antiporter ClcA
MFDESLEDEGILFYAVIKWLVLSVIAGLLVGGSVGLFLIILYKSIDWVAALPDQRYILIPVGLLASLYSIRIFAPAAAGHGTEKVIAAIHYHAAKIPFSVVPIKILSTLFTLAPGAVVGTEGPSVQIGGGIMSWVARLIRCRTEERKKLVVCGVAAALSAVFGAPIAGAVFGVEVLFVGEIFYTVLLPAVVSGIIAYFVCLKLGVPYDIPSVAVPALDMSVLSWCFAAALFFSLVCIFHIEFMAFIERTFKKMTVPAWVKSLIASGLILCVVAFSGERFLGMGEKGLVTVLSGHPLIWYAFIVKSFLLATTLSGGGSGGVLTPTFYIGAAAGGLFAQIFGLDVGFFGALGFVGCVAGCVNTPLAATFLAMEMFGSSIAPYAGGVCVICYMLSGHRSLYPTQILVQPKSSAFVLADPENKQSWQIRRRKTYLQFPRIFRLSKIKEKTRQK